MKIAVIGLGSMGKRRIRNIKAINSEIEIFGIDSNPERCAEAEKIFSIETSPTFVNLIEKIKLDSVFVCTSPNSHAVIINECLNQNLHVFTEINLSPEMYLENEKLAKQKGLVCFLSSTFLFRSETKKIMEIVEAQNYTSSYSYHVGQYLPDWHPWEHYQNYFVANKATNACREILAIELPWLQKCFGKVSNFQVLKSKKSSLSIDYYDTYQIIFEHKAGHSGTLTVDVVSRKAVRKLELVNEFLYLTWDGTPESLVNYNFQTKLDEKIVNNEKIEHNDGYSSFIIENAYLNEVKEFFSCISEKKYPDYTFSDDIISLKLIDAIEA